MAEREGGRVAVVVGAAGFVGSHVVELLVSKGYRVRGTARDAAAAEWLRDRAAARGGDVALSPLTLRNDGTGAEAALRALMAGARAAFFCAGHERRDPSTVDFMVNNAVACVRAARGAGVPAVVFTSSGGSTNPPGLPSGTPKSEVLHWSDAAQQKAAGKWSPAAKTLMELAVLREVGRDAANRVVDPAAAAGAPRLCIVNPNLILGPQLRPGPVRVGSGMITMLLRGRGPMAKRVLNDSMSIIDVRDLAALHVACAELPSASGRYFGVNRSWPWEGILRTLGEQHAGYTPPPRFRGEAKEPTQFDHTRKESLGVPLRSLADTLADLVAFLQERGEIPARAGKL